MKLIKLNNNESLAGNIKRSRYSKSTFSKISIIIYATIIVMNLTFLGGGVFNAVELNSLIGIHDLEKIVILLFSTLISTIFLGEKVLDIKHSKKALERSAETIQESGVSIESKNLENALIISEHVSAAKGINFTSFSNYIFFASDQNICVCREQAYSRGEKLVSDAYLYSDLESADLAEEKGVTLTHLTPAQKHSRRNNH